jgi:hypothetical protein
LCQVRAGRAEFLINDRVQFMRFLGLGLMVLVFEDLLGVAFRSALDRS